MKTLRSVGHVGRASHLSHTPCLQAPYLIRPTNHNRQPTLLHRPHPPHRTFLSNPFATESQTISATRTFPYPAQQIFAVISDVSSYSQYFPFCQKSIVTKYSQPARANGQKYPEEAKLVVGFNEQASEEFWSRIYCVPEKTVEAVSGAAETTLEASEIGHHNARPVGEQDPTRKDTVLSHLSTKWTLQPHQRDAAKTDVSLRIDFRFVNPVYAALSQAAVPKVADKMIEAFEKRLDRVAKSREG